MKKTGLPLDYPNIPQLSSVAATHLAAALLHTCPPEALPPEGDGRGRTPRRSANARKRKGPHTSCGPIPFVRLACAHPPSPRFQYIILCFYCQGFRAVARLRLCRCLPSRATPPPEGDGRGRALRRSAWLSPFAAASSAALLPGRAASPVRIAAARRAAGSPTPRAWAFPLALPFPECGAQRRACCLPLSTVLCYTWGGGVRYGKVPPHDIRRPPAP